MKQTISHLADKGTVFSNAFASSPICCPSRSSILTGLYPHNHATRNNSRSGGCYGDFWKNKIETKALPVLLNSNGYETFYAGKYLNKYKSTKVPPGWNQWFGLYGNSKYYNYTLNENGVPKEYNDEYLTDVIRIKSLNFLKTRDPSKPFFAMISPPAPHAPFTPAPRHESAFPTVNALRTPNFNIPSGPLDKHWLIRMPPSQLPPKVLDELDMIFRLRWKSLLAVDEMIEDIIKKVEELKIDEETYIIFTSDNGYHIGQFAQAYDKRQPYETDIRVPFMIRGPNIQPKTMIDYPIALIDLAPTILEFAGIPIPSSIDGESFAQYLKGNVEVYPNPEKFERQLLIEYWGEGSTKTYNPDCPWRKSDKLTQCSLASACQCQDSWNNTYGCIRHLADDINFIYCEFKDNENFVEAYDLSVDPYQIDNIGFDMLPSSRAQYSLALANFKTCIGENCWRIF